MAFVRMLGLGLTLETMMSGHVNATAQAGDRTPELTGALRRPCHRSSSIPSYVAGEILTWTGWTGGGAPGRRLEQQRTGRKPDI